MDSVSVKPKPSFDQSISGFVIAFAIVVLFCCLLFKLILFVFLLLLLPLRLLFPMCRCDDKAPPFILLLLEEEEATKLELLLFTEAETGPRKTTEDIIISFHRRRAFSLSLSLSFCSRKRGGEVKRFWGSLSPSEKATLETKKKY
jgi:hypothetical protein